MKYSRAGNEGDNKMKAKLPKMSAWPRIFYALLVSLLVFNITKGDPKRVTILRQIEITDQKLDIIYETTIAVQTKKIKQRITEQSNGIWKIIDKYVDTKKWMEIEVELKTRIGIKLNSIFYDKLNNNIHLDFGEPEVLDRTYKSKLIDHSQSFINKWSIAQFEQHKQSFISELIDSESSNLVELFKSDKNKINSLQRQYHDKILNSIAQSYHAMSLQILALKLNFYIINLVGKILPQKVLGPINKTYYYSKQLVHGSSKPLQQDKKPHQQKIKNKNNKMLESRHERLQSSRQQSKRARIRQKLGL